MTHSIKILAGTVLLAASLSGPAFSQGSPQTVTLMKVDPASLATGLPCIQGSGQYRRQRGERDRGDDRRSDHHAQR